MVNATLCELDSGAGQTTTKYMWGVVLGLLGSIAINTGNNIQSLGMKQLEDLARNEAKKRNEVFDPHGLKVDNCGSKVWVFGTTVFLSGSLLNFGSYGLAPQSVLACLGTYSCHVKFIPCQSVSTSYAVVVSCFTTAITYDYHDYCLPDL